MAVYFIQQGDAGPIKIGTATDPHGRLNALQVGASERLRFLAVAPGGRLEEAELHRRFSMLRTRGEWFAAAPDLLAFVTTVPRPGPRPSRPAPHRRRGPRVIPQSHLARVVAYVVEHPGADITAIAKGIGVARRVAAKRVAVAQAYHRLTRTGPYGDAMFWPGPRAMDLWAPMPKP